MKYSVLLFVSILVLSVDFAAQNASLKVEGEKHLANIKQLTFGGENAEAYFSSDGKRLIFQSKRDEHKCDQIYTMNIDGSMVQKVSNGIGSNESPSYSPDGRYITYTSNRGNKTDIYIMLWEGTNPTQITKSGDCVNPDWSPRLP